MEIKETAKKCYCRGCSREVLVGEVVFTATYQPTGRAKTFMILCDYCLERISEMRQEYRDKLKKEVTCI